VGDFTHIAMARQSPTGVGSHNKTIAHRVGSHKGKAIAHGVGSHKGNKAIAHRGLTHEGTSIGERGAKIWSLLATFSLAAGALR
jgi:hypothetical protein